MRNTLLRNVSECLAERKLYTTVVLMIYKTRKNERKKERKKERRMERKNMAKLTVTAEGWSYMDEGTLLPKS